MSVDALELDGFVQDLLKTTRYSAADRARMAAEYIKMEVLDAAGLDRSTDLTVPVEWQHKVPAPKPVPQVARRRRWWNRRG